VTKKFPPKRRHLSTAVHSSRYHIPERCNI